MILYFQNFLLNIGEGKEQQDKNEDIKLPSNIIIPYEEDILSLQKLINIVFPNIYLYHNNLNFMINRVILSPKK